MGYKIPEMFQSRKAHDIALIAIFCLLGVVSFGLGRLSVVPLSANQVELCATVPIPLAQTAQVSAFAQNPASVPTAQSPDTGSQGQYVASKTGTVYHFPWCSGAKRIKEDNKIWFSTKEAARAAGYRPANNCKGLE